MEGSEHGRIVAGADPAITPELKDFAGLHKMKLVSDVGELLSDPNVDGVILATPHSMHHSHVVNAAKSKKHIFAEKPFALKKKDAVDMIENAKKAGVTHLVEFRQADLFMSDFREATVITLYLLPELNVKLRPRLLAELKPGTRIVSHQFDMGDWKADKKLESAGRTIYFWTIPASRKYR